MKKLATLFLLLITISANAYNWESPIDIKYKRKSLELFNKFNMAREINDNKGADNSKLVEVEKLLQEVIEQDNSFAPAYRELGRVYISKGYINTNKFSDGSLNPSEVSILKAIEIEPKYADAYVLLGHLYTHQKRYEDARKALNKAKEIGTQTAWLNANSGYLYFELDKYDLSLSEYMKVVNSGTKETRALAAAYSKIASIYSTKNLLPKANEWYLKTVELEPDNAWGWGNYASFLLFKYNDVDSSIEKFEKALSISNYGLARFQYACALYTKWAILVDGPPTRVPAQTYFDRAYDIYPNIEAVIEETNKYPYTKITALKLSKFINNSK